MPQRSGALQFGGGVRCPAKCDTGNVERLVGVARAELGMIPTEWL